MATVCRTVWLVRSSIAAIDSRFRRRQPYDPAAALDDQRSLAKWYVRGRPAPFVGETVAAARPGGAAARLDARHRFDVCLFVWEFHVDTQSSTPYQKL